MNSSSKQPQTGLHRDIRSWDGKSADDIHMIFKRHSEMDKFAETLALLLPDPTYQKGASWLIKQYLENNGLLSPVATKVICKSVSSLQYWESRLHVLQCLPHLTIPAAGKKEVEKFVRHCLLDEVKFVRAWAYFGFYVLARQHPSLQTEAMQILKLGLSDEPASVQARIRKALAAGF